MMRRSLVTAATALVIGSAPTVALAGPAGNIQILPRNEENDGRGGTNGPPTESFAHAEMGWGVRTAPGDGLYGGDYDGGYGLLPLRSVSTSFDQNGQPECCASMWQPSSLDFYKSSWAANYKLFYDLANFEPLFDAPIRPLQHYLSGAIGSVTIGLSACTAAGDYGCDFDFWNPAILGFSVKTFYDGSLIGTASFPKEGVSLFDEVRFTYDIPKFSAAGGILSFEVDLGLRTKGSLTHLSILFDPVASNPVPEPSSWTMLIAGFGLIGAVARRRCPALAA